VTDEYWEAAEPLLPEVDKMNLGRIADPNAGRGRRPVHPRLILQAIIHVVVNRISWYQLPEQEFGLSYGTAAIAFRRWSREGFFARLHHAGLASHAEWERVAWEWQQTDNGPVQVALTAMEPTKPLKLRSKNPPAKTPFLKQNSRPAVGGRVVARRS
jgi:transposase